MVGWGSITNDKEKCTNERTSPRIGNPAGNTAFYLTKHVAGPTELLQGQIEDFVVSIFNDFFWS